MDFSQQGDVAFVVFKDPPMAIEPIAFDDWTKNGSILAVGAEVLACGFPAALRKVEGRMTTPKIGAFHGRVTSLGGNTENLDQLDLLEFLPHPEVAEP